MHTMPLSSRLPTPMVRALAALVVVFSSTGCIHHQIAFVDDDSEWHHQVEGSRIQVPLVIEVSQETREADYMFSAMTAGYANRWHARYGEMFMQALAVEMDQLAPNHTLTTQASSPDGHLLQLDVTKFLFENFSADTAVEAVLSDPAGNELMREQYAVVGNSNGGKVLGLGAFGMKSAVRQSTLNAYQRIFDEMRDDLRAAMPGHLR